MRFPTDKDSQKSKGYAFVDIHRVSDAKRVSEDSALIEQCCRPIDFRFQ